MLYTIMTIFNISNTPVVSQFFLSVLLWLLYTAGSWLSILICGIVGWLSYAHFRKVFANLGWKIAFLLTIGLYMIYFLYTSSGLTADIFAGHGGQVLFGEELYAYAFIQLAFGAYVLLFTVAYGINYLYRLMKSKRRGNKNGEGEVV